ncbi:MAG: formimidoylglutamase, partial [Flavobacteriales bacterium]|nr:formimidoylglutamase [Flavobacteriales bacterium]
SEVNADLEDGINAIRRKLYGLKDHFAATEIVDLGNIRPGETVEDTYYAVSSSVSSIIKEGGIAVILGGGQDLTYANYLAYEKLEQVVNLFCVDSRFDLGDAEDELAADRFLQKIILHQPNVLFNYSNLGYQSYHVDEKEIDLISKMYFDAYRLGEVQNSIESVEPIVRNADMVSFDLSSIRQSDNPANYRSEPNGFYGEEACAIARYAGLSDKLTSIGFYDSNTSSDKSGQASHLVAQIIWYFISGISNRKADYPFADKEEYLKYTVFIEDGQYEIIFYKSQRSDRWWMEVPYPSKRGAKYQRHFMVPCSYEDYQMALNEEIPDRWWQTYQKLG